jgi:hypothetical protein
MRFCIKYVVSFMLSGARGQAEIMRGEPMGSDRVFPETSRKKGAGKIL